MAAHLLREIISSFSPPGPDEPRVHPSKCLAHLALMSPGSTLVKSTEWSSTLTYHQPFRAHRNVLASEEQVKLQETTLLYHPPPKKKKFVCIFSHKSTLSWDILHSVFSSVFCKQFGLCKRVWKIHKYMYLTSWLSAVRDSAESIILAVVNPIMSLYVQKIGT